MRLPHHGHAAGTEPLGESVAAVEDLVLLHPTTLPTLSNIDTA
jgi:hypothetical protein